jgi:hypothetical protein
MSLSRMVMLRKFRKRGKEGLRRGKQEHGIWVKERKIGKRYEQQSMKVFWRT